MYQSVKYENFIVLCNGFSRLLGNIVKILSYPFHALFPKKRFTIPEFSAAKLSTGRQDKINRTIWQTNYSNKVTLPIYCNYLFNRLMSLSYDYRYISTENREEYIKAYAEPHVFNAYSQLTDGAAQADFWRVFILSQIIREQDSEVLIKRGDKYTNFFLACETGHPIMKATLDLIVENIENRRIDGGVFAMTGPETLNAVINPKMINTRQDKVTCTQGTFTNEYFQYIDKPRSKWIYKKSEDLLK